ncbi:protein SMG5-like isoform X3 [Octopus sinensis]|uniref:Protein SMG5-like isoform X3 n=1 Tax=Octopus sinensis TaxID=2607531 RepID=A0A6P7SJ64_9MOLL|nr:protein SMG5-like isoform X3 [Octopus sinensis]
MKKAGQKKDEVKPEVDKARRVYRAALDAIRRLDDLLQQKRAYRNVFTQDAVGLRNKLKYYCERLMFYNPIDYGRKAEEVLWRKVFYDIIQLVKRNKRHIRPHGSLETAFRTHLAAATGYYYHLLLRLQTEFCLQLDGKLDFPVVPDHSTGKKSQLHNSKKKEVSITVQEWALGACHRCLVYLGDIARYQQDFDHSLSNSTAERFYYQALCLLPDVGIPHNQLGSLVASRYFHTEAAYHYIRCLVSQKPFDGAHGNLKRLLEKNLKRFTELSQKSPRDLPPEQQRPRDIKRFFVYFLYLLDIFYNNSRNVEAPEIQECCQKTLQDFNLCMFYEPVCYNSRDNVFTPLRHHSSSSIDHLQYLDDDIVFKIAVICMATVHLLERNGSRQVTAAMAFLLALFSHILNHVVIRLQGALYDRENLTKLAVAGAGDEADDKYDNSHSSPGGNNGLSFDNSHLTIGNVHKAGNDKPISNVVWNLQQAGQNNGDSATVTSLDKKKKLNLRNLKRRRRRHHSGSSNGSVVSDEESDLSEGGEDIIEEDDMLTEESDDDLGSYLEHDSDSDLSDTLIDGQDLPSNFSLTGKNNQLLTNGAGLIDFRSNIAAVAAAAEAVAAASGVNGSWNIRHSNSCNSNIWTDAATNVSLVHFSTELLSTSATFLGQKLELNLKNSKVGTSDNSVDYTSYKDNNYELKNMMLSGYNSVEDWHSAEITQKLHDFVIETDTETSRGPTDTELSSALSETDAEGDTQLDRNENDRLHLQHVIEVIQNEGLLHVVKVLCDWMKCHASVITTCAQSSQSLWCRLSVLLNFLPLETDLPVDREMLWPENLRYVVRDVVNPAWKQIYPLREDINLQLFQPLAELHANVNFDKQFKLNERQECFLRISCLRQFGHWVTQLPGIDLSYRQKEAMFFGPTNAGDTVENEKVAQERMVSNNNLQYII